MARSDLGKGKGRNSVRGWRMKKSGGQSGGLGYHEKIDGKAHERSAEK